MKDSVSRPIGRIAKDQALLLSVLAALFVAFIVLVVLLIASERNRNTLLAEYEADRAATALFETYRESNAGQPGTGQSQTQSVQDLPSNIEGFGVYAADGRALRTLGDAPASVVSLIAPGQPRLFRFDQRTGTIELVRILGAMPGQFRPFFHFRGQVERRGRMFGMMGQFPSPEPFQPQRERSLPTYLFVKMSSRAFFSNRNLLTLALILVPIALGAAMVVVWLLYRRNRRYREKIASQQNLVHLGEIARTLSHEIKNPLSSIRLQTGIMRRVFEDRSPRELTLIEEETDRLTQLVERIGEFLRDPTGRPDTVELGSFLRDLVGRFDWNVESMDLPAEPVFVRFDRDRLRTVLENLLKNASESGGERTPFSLSLRAARQRAELSILDRGPGLPEDAREKIFDPFYTTKVKGSGIGLAISKRFVEALDGSLLLQNVREGGTEARITLPRLFPEDDSRQEERGSE